MRPAFFELLELIERFPEDVARRCIRRDTREIREIFAERLQDAEQALGWKHERIAVCKEDAAHAVSIDRVGHRDLAHDLIVRELFKFHAAIHVAVCAAVVCAPAGDTENEAVCFTRRAEDGGVPVVKK